VHGVAKSKKYTAVASLGTLNFKSKPGNILIL